MMREVITILGTSEDDNDGYVIIPDFFHDGRMRTIDLLGHNLDFALVHSGPAPH